MGPSKTSSSKGKSTDKGRDGSDWNWHAKGGYYTRTNGWGQTERWDPPGSSQQQDTPRSSRDNILLNNSSNPSSSLPCGDPNVEENSYSATLEARDDYSTTTSTRSYQTATTSSENYTVASPLLQTTSSRGPAISFSPQLTSSLSKAPNAGSSSGYGPASGSSQYQYASQSGNYGNRSYENSHYDNSDGVVSALNDMSLTSSSAVPEQGGLPKDSSLSRNLTSFQIIPIPRRILSGTL
jgi:hypothetical protein